MAARKKPADAEGQEIDPTEENILIAAQTMRNDYHETRGRTDFKTWEDLAPEKQQRWIDKATGKGE